MQKETKNTRANSDEEIEFVGRLSPMATALSIHGTAGGIRITIDIGENYLQQAIQLLNMRNQEIRFKIIQDDIIEDDFEEIKIPVNTRNWFA